MDRRAFIGTLAGGLVAAPLAAEGQLSTAIHRIGWLSYSESTAAGGRYLDVFRRGLAEMGYVEGTNVRIELRWAHGKEERLSVLAEELVRAGVRVIVALDPPSMRAAGHATHTVPIVARFSEDPAEARLVESLARPGSNLTGVTSISAALYGKRLELLRDALPPLASVGVILDREGPASPAAFRETQAAAKRLGLRVHILEVKQGGDLDRAFQLAREQRVGAVVPLRSPLLVRDRMRVVRLANQSRLPAIYDERTWTELGGLMAFGANLDDVHRRVAAYVDRILRGAKPADLPVEQPTVFELTINLKTAKALGLMIPPSFLQRADQVIE